MRTCRFNLVQSNDNLDRVGPLAGGRSCGCVYHIREAAHHVGHGVQLAFLSRKRPANKQFGMSKSVLRMKLCALVKAHTHSRMSSCIPTCPAKPTDQARLLHAKASSMNPATGHMEVGCISQMRQVQKSLSLPPPMHDSHDSKIQSLR